VCVVIIIATVMLLRDFWPYGIIFRSMFLPLWIFPFITRNFLSYSRVFQ
jgi:hypothetical protein